MDTPMTIIINQLLKGDASCLTQDVIFNINQIVCSLLPKQSLNELELNVIKDILHISNIIYNNTDKSILVLEDGIYDLLLEKYKKYDENFQVGAEPVNFNNQNNIKNDINIEEETGSVFIHHPWIDTKEFLFENELKNSDFYGTPYFAEKTNHYISKRLKNTNHKYPKLVGTLHKAKFTLDSDAIYRGVYDDSNVKIFERDFLRKHVQEGIINPNDITLVLELKYDGVSIEAEVTDKILSARTRGETQRDQASDLTPILEGYTFSRANGYNITPFGMKFEAVISYRNLRQLSLEIGKYYANARNAIIGILGNSNAINLAKYITLVPLQTSHNNMNRIEEIEFMNKYYSTGEFLRYAVVRGNYEQVLFQVNKFVQEAEAMRDILPIMYDGVVVSYLDENIRAVLGRKNFVNEYSIAIKFNTKKKLTRVRNITYTIGANGDITPMIHYDPVEFYGMINTKSSGHSYSRFQELSLRPGDVIEIEFVNDVMAYIRKANVEENQFNPNKYFSFIKKCPSCGQTLVLSETGKNVVCNNMLCPARTVARVTNMLSKLGFKGFSEETVKKLNISGFSDLMSLTPDRANILGEVNAKNILEATDNLYNSNIPDYNILGSLGFTGIAATKWKNVLKYVSLHEIITSSEQILYFRLTSAKNGIGNKTAITICNERKFFMKDLIYIYNNMPNIIFTKDIGDSQISFGKTIRFSGVRDAELQLKLLNLGHDCSDGSITKSTDILIIPYVGYTSSKVSKAEKYNSQDPTHKIVIVPLDEFRLNETYYLKK